MCSIDDATEADVPRLVELLSVLFSLGADFEPSPDKQRQGLRGILNQPDVGRIFVARWPDGVVGMLGLLFSISTVEGGRVAWLEDVVVASECRGEGVGTLLVRHAVDFARRSGIARVTGTAVWTLTYRRPVARAFPRLDAADRSHASCIYAPHGPSPWSLLILRRASSDVLERMARSNAERRELARADQTHRKHRLSFGVPLGGLLGVLCPIRST